MICPRCPSPEKFLYGVLRGGAKNGGRKRIPVSLFLFLLLFRTVAGVRHCTMGASAATGGFALFLLPDEIDYYQRHYSGKNEAYYNGCNILR